ncbi:unnamed protein product [Citrullus colocynthis]|uniref:Uncharacterized protein n=1 Tax=Citrullus colocynthis TaxID=252529 RepID=A0ABP0Z1S9_9ROSI
MSGVVASYFALCLTKLGGWIYIFNFSHFLPLIFIIQLIFNNPSCFNYSFTLLLLSRQSQLLAYKLRTRPLQFFAAFNRC